MRATVAAAALQADGGADPAAAAAARRGADRLAAALARCSAQLAALHSVAWQQTASPHLRQLPSALLSALLEPAWAALAALGRAMEDVAAAPAEGEADSSGAALVMTAARVGASLAACAPAAAFGAEPLPPPEPDAVTAAGGRPVLCDTDAALVGHIHAAGVLLTAADGVLGAGLAGAASIGAFSAALAPVSTGSSRWATPLALLQTQRLGMERADAARAAATAALVAAVCCPGGGPSFADVLAPLALGRRAAARWPGVLLQLEGVRQRLLGAAAGARSAAVSAAGAGR